MNILDEKGFKAKRKTKPIKYVINKGCWECISHALNKSNYPHVKRNGKLYRMNRYVYKIYYGEIPDGLFVCHTCDNPKCINPEHLFLGTPKDNMQDMSKKGRGGFQGKSLPEEIKLKMSKTLKGRKQSSEHKRKRGLSKRILNNEQLIDIRQCLINGQTIKSISEKFNISKSTVERIKYGKSPYTEFLNGGYKEWINNG